MKNIRHTAQGLGQAATRALHSLAALALLSLGAAAQGQASDPSIPADPANYSRTASYTYRTDGLLLTETVEPGITKLCAVTTYGYDGWGNRTSASSANCAGVAATDNAYFTPRTNTEQYGLGASSNPSGQSVTVAGVTVTSAPGSFANVSANALGHSETRLFDPRFGAVLSQTNDANGLSTRAEFDGFGRTVREWHSDRTNTVSAYCLIAGRGVSDLSSNSPLCASLGYAAGEVPSDAISLVHTEPHDASDADTAPLPSAKNGAYSRVYLDKAGRKIRSITEGFDGSVIAQDWDYNNYGAQTVSTQPYFLASQSSTLNGVAHYGMSLNVYDVLGRVIQSYSTDVQNMPVPGVPIGNMGGYQTSINFGSRGLYQAALTRINYNGLSTTTVNDQGKTRVEDKDINGKVARVTDALGSKLNLQYDAFGNLVLTTDPLQNQVSLVYDIRGRKRVLGDPDSGQWQYDYDALGQLVWQQNATQRAAGTQTRLVYDVLGRLISRTEPEYTSTWVYDRYADGSSCMAGSLANRSAGKLCESSTDRGVNRKQYYDAQGRPQNTRLSISNGPSLASALSYDANGRLATQTYPSGLQLQYAYNPRGYLTSLSNLGTLSINPLPATPGGVPAASQTRAQGTPLWTAQSVNAWGHAEQSQLGNGLTSKRRYDPSTGRVLSDTAGMGTATNVLNYTYIWSSLGRLYYRGDINGDGSTGSVVDSYGYDDLGRLTGYSVSSPQLPGYSRAVNLQYSVLGQLLSKTDVGTYAYPAQGGGTGSKPHAVQSVAGINYGYDANGNLVSASSGPYRSVTYTSFNLPDSQGGLQGPVGSPQYTWQYDENHQRIKETRVVAGATRITWIMHPDNQGGLGFESEQSPDGSISNRHYLSVGGRAIGVLVTSGALPSLAAGQLSPNAQASVAAVKLEYWHKDQLGSLVTTTDHLGQVTARYAYDPFGKRRQITGAYDAAGTVVGDWIPNINHGTDRGYTGHEHLDDVGVIHMNGRIFDPTLGRFMQADPMVQDPLNLQNYDRYVYCYNNPTSCTDPSGHESCVTNPHQIICGVYRFFGFVTHKTESKENSAPAKKEGESQKTVGGVNEGTPRPDSPHTGSNGSNKKPLGGGAGLTEEEREQLIRQALLRSPDTALAGACLGNEKACGASGLLLLGGGGGVVLSASVMGRVALITAGVQLDLQAAGDGMPVGGGLGKKLVTSEVEAVAAKGRLRIDPNGAFSKSEVEAAWHMAAQGRSVVLRSPSGTRAAGGTSDLLVDGVRYDVYTPTTSNANRIVSAIARKNSQAEGIVLDLSNSSVTRDQLGNVLGRVNGAGATNIRDIVIIGGH